MAFRVRKLFGTFDELLTNWRTYLKDKRQVIGMFMSVPWRFPDSHFYNDAPHTPYVTAATIALSTQHLSRDKLFSTTGKWS